MSGFNPIKYFTQVKQELQKVTWPTREQTIEMTTIVIAVSLITGVYLGGLDFVFTRLIAYIVR